MDAWIPVVAALGGTVVGGLLTWFLEERRWKREETRRRHHQAEVAAGELMKLVEEARDLFQESAEFNDGPDQAAIYPLYRDIRRFTIDIPNAHARELLGKIATCFYNYHGARNYGFRPRRCAYVAAEAGRSVLGAIRRGETIPDVSSMEEIHDAIVEHYESLAEAEAEYRNQRRSGES